MKRPLLLALLIAALFAGCRKKLYTGPDASLGSGNNTPYFVKPWRKISFPDFNDVRCFAIFNGQLYAGGGFENSMDYDFLVKVHGIPYGDYTYPDTYTGGFDYIQRVTDNFYDFGTLVGIRSMKVIDGKLYIGGKFRYQASDNWNDLMYMDADGSFHPVGFSQYTNTQLVNDVGVYDNHPLICGNFTSNSVTDYVCGIQNETATAMADLNGVTYDSEVYHNTLYVVGDQDQIVRWNGSDWTSVAYPGKTLTDKIYSVTVVNDELYFLGDFAGNTVLKKYSETAGWSDDLSITSFSVPNFARLQVFGGHVFIIGKDFKSNNVTGSIWRYSTDGSWERFGNLTNRVYDVILFDGKYFAAAEDGLYLY
jgi:hypothetical protein